MGSLVSSMISVRHTDVRYGAGPEAARAPLALEDLCVEVPRGRLTLLCGASGSGKSTALQLLNGLVPHFHSCEVTGQVLVNGVDVPRADIADTGRTTASVFQNPRTQFFTSDVASELAFQGENYGLPPAEIIDRAERAAGQVGIAHLLDRSLTQLSGGELQKVACAQAIAAGTEVLLFDEPTSSLSPEAIEEFAGLLSRLRAAGRTIVVAEHRVYFLRGLVDHVLVLSGGRVVRRMGGAAFFSLDDAERRELGLRTLTRPAGVRGPVRRARASAAAASGLEVEDLSFSYRRGEVLRIDHLRIPAGQVTAVVGPNGAGKSTLAKVLCGLATPGRATHIRLDGRETTPRSRIADSYIVMQDVHRQLFSDTVAGEVTLGLSEAQAHALDVHALLADLSLDELADRHPLSLSGGQKQRLVIASAIACRKRVYVFDEPTSGVDHRHLVEISAHLRSLAASGAVVLLISHDLELLDECADAVLTVHPLADVPAGAEQVTLEPSGRNS